MDVDVDWSLTDAGDSPQQIAIHRAESAGIDFVKQEMHPEIADVEAAIRERFNL